MSLGLRKHSFFYEKKTIKVNSDIKWRTLDKMVDEKSKSSKQILSFNPPPLKTVSVCYNNTREKDSYS